MKVLAVASHGALGGAELSLVEFLRHRPHDVEVVGLLVADGPLREQLREQGIAVAAARGYGGRPTLGKLVRFTRSLLRLLSIEQPDVVWATGLKAATLTAPACRLAGIPVVWHKVDFTLDHVLTMPLGLAVNGVVSVSGAVADALGPLRKRRLLAVIGPPVRLSDAVAVVPCREPPVIGTLASLVPIKGQHHILEAAAILAPEFPGLSVVLAGAGSPDFPDYPAELRTLAARLGLAERLTLAGFAADPVTVLSQLTVFVNATYRDGSGFGLEGLSGAMLEASWAGLPVVATRGGGTPEGVLDGVTGTLVEAGNPAAIARAVAPYLRDPELALAAGQAGRRYTRDRFAPATGARLLFDALGRVQRAARFPRGPARVGAR